MQKVINAGIMPCQRLELLARNAWPIMQTQNADDEREQRLRPEAQLGTRLRREAQLETREGELMQEFADLPNKKYTGNLRHR